MDIPQDRIIMTTSNLKNPSKETLVRLNSRIEKHQLAFIKQEAVRLSKEFKRPVSEGETSRIIINFYINNKK